MTAADTTSANSSQSTSSTTSVTVHFIPRVGGGKTIDDLWTDGSNITSKFHPITIYAWHPSDFRGAEKVESHCRSNLPKERHLGLEEEPSFVSTLTYWITEVKKKCENCQMDTVFKIYDIVPSTDHSNPNPTKTDLLIGALLNPPSCLLGSMHLLLLVLNHLPPSIILYVNLISTIWTGLVTS